MTGPRKVALYINGHREGDEHVVPDRPAPDQGLYQLDLTEPQASRCHHESGIGMPDGEE